MANILIASGSHTWADPRYAAVAVGGGQFLAQLPVSNVLGRSLLTPARTIDTDPASTQLVVDLGALRSIRCFALPYVRAVRADGSIGGDLGLIGRFRVIDGPNPLTATVMADSGDIAQYPVTHPRWPMRATDPRFFSGRMLPEEAEAFDWRQPLLWLPESEVLGRYVWVTLVSAAPDLVHLDLSPIVLTSGDQPAINAAYGVRIGVEDLSEVQALADGGEAIRVGARPRVLRFTLPSIGWDEGLSTWFDMLWRGGVSRPAFLVLDPDDQIHRHRIGFWGRFRQPNSLEWYSVSRGRQEFEFVEALNLVTDEDLA